MSSHRNDAAPPPDEKAAASSTSGQPRRTGAPAEEKQPSTTPSFAATEDEPLATAGTGGSEDPKGKVRPGADVVPAGTDEFNRRKARLDEADARGRANE